MFGMSMTEILFVLAIALIILGPEKLPKLARQVGGWVREFRKITTDLRANLEVEELRANIREQMADAPQREDYVDPYKQAIAEGRKRTEVLEKETPFADYHEPEPYEQDDAYVARPWDYGPAGAVALETFDDERAADFDRCVTTVPLDTVTPDPDLTRQNLPHPPVELLGNLTAVPVTGGLAELKTLSME